MQSSRYRQPVSQRNFEEPETEQIDDRWRECISSSVERLEHHHAIGIADVAVTDDAQARCSQRHNARVVREKANDGLAEDHEEHSTGSEENHAVKAGAPHRGVGALRAVPPPV